MEILIFHFLNKYRIIAIKGTAKSYYTLPAVALKRYLDSYPKAIVRNYTDFPFKE